MIKFILNDKAIITDLSPGMVLLDFIRYHQHLTGTKIGCREGDCGACTVLVGKIDGAGHSLAYDSMTSCLMPLANAHGKHIVTIEGINFPGKLNPIQQAMADEGATQCGFCTPGFVISLAGHCLNGKQNVIESIDGNICRCTGYKSIERAAEKFQLLLNERSEESTVSFATKNEILPPYFSNIYKKLQVLFPELKTQSLPSTVAEEITSIPKTTGTILAGGTDLYVQKHEQMVHADARYVFDDDELNGIHIENNTCVIGGSSTVTDLKQSAIFNEAFPSFQLYIRLVSSTPIRNMATIAGNFVNASPIGDMTVFFLALDATIELSPNAAANGSSRTVPLKKFYKGYKLLDKQPNELITRIRFELPTKNNYFNFEKVSKRTHLDIASVNSAICLKLNGGTIETVALSAGGVGPIPLFLEKTAAYLEGKTISNDLIFEAINVMQTEIPPISDARGSKEYKTLLLGQLLKAHLVPLLDAAR